MKFFNQKKVLVTGGAGFIGSHLCHRLVELGAKVTVLDNLSTGSRDNLATVKNEITLIEGSITDYQTCLDATREKDLVFHLAAFVSVPASVEKPLACHEVNITGTANLLEACRANKIGRFVFSSSSAVYGNHEGVCDEKTPCQPTSPYGLSKWVGELYCRQYAQGYGVGTVCLRYFNVYGQRQSPQGAYAAVVAKFAHQLKNDLPVTIFGDGSQTRDFIPVAKVVEANLSLAQLPPAAMTGEAYNIATGTSTSLLELYRTLKTDHPGTTSTLEFRPARPGDIGHSAASVAKYHTAIKQILNNAVQ